MSDLIFKKNANILFVGVWHVIWWQYGCRVLAGYRFVLSLTACDRGCDSVPLVVDTLYVKCRTCICVSSWWNGSWRFSRYLVVFCWFGTAHWFTAEERFVPTVVDERRFTLGTSWHLVVCNVWNEIVTVIAMIFARFRYCRELEQIL